MFSKSCMDIGLLAFVSVLPAKAAESGLDWAASWTTAIQSAYVAPTTPQAATVSPYDPQPDLSFPLPNATTAGADNQTFRMIIKPDISGLTVRIRLSNAFGTQPVTFSAAAIALQAYQATIVPGTSTPVTFHGGAKSVTVAAGGTVLSDAVDLDFVGWIGLDALAGRNLAVSFAVRGANGGATGPASYHDGAFTTNYISAPNSGDVTSEEDDVAFPFTTMSFFFLNELDVMARPTTLVIVAYGDSITDGTFSSLNGNDRRLNVMSRQLHKRLGNRVSVVNEAIADNAVSGPLAGQSAVDRLSRGVLSVSGAGLVVWLEGINDLGALGTTAAPIIAGYKDVVNRLHARNIAVIGATLTPSLVPGGIPPANSPLIALDPTDQHGTYQTDAYRKQVNAFILSSPLYDGTADFSAATIDPSTGTLKAPFVPNSEGSAGDYLHPNRYGYQAMGLAGAAAVLKLLPH